RRVRFTAATDEQVLAAMETVIRHEGIVPALESAHAFAAALAEIPDMSPQQSVIINQSGRGDKDIFTIAEAFGDSKWQQFIKERADEY
ncbi:tryptophan synthase subunit beta, partial [Solemya velum gill symbiont]